MVFFSSLRGSIFAFCLALGLYATSACAQDAGADAYTLDAYTFDSYTLDAHPNDGDARTDRAESSRLGDLSALRPDTETARADLPWLARPSVPDPRVTPTGATPTAVAPPVEDETPSRDAPTRYVITASLNAQRHEVDASGTLTWRNTSSVAVSDLWMHLYLNGFANERTLFMRSTGGEHRGNDRGRFGRIELQAIGLETPEGRVELERAPGSELLDPSELHLSLPRAVAPGACITLAMRWKSVLPEVFARTGYHGSFHMVAQWFPKIAVLEPEGTWGHFAFHGNTEFYADFGSYDVTLDVPRGFVVGAVGERLGSVEHRAQGDRVRYLTRSVHDFAFTAWDDFREMNGVAGDTEVRVLFPQGEESQAARALEALRVTVPFFNRRFGQYPYPNLTVMFPPEGADGAGGMEYPTFITTEADWWMPERMRFVEYVTVHEYGHQYFYGLFASNESAFPMLDEGLTEWATCLGMENLAPPDGLLAWFSSARLSCMAQETASSAGISHPQPVITPAADFPNFGSYAVHVYSRTAATLRTAENLYGSERVAGAFRRYAQRARFRHPTPEDLFTAFDQELGPGVTDVLLRPALSEASSVDYEIASVEDIDLGRGQHQGRVIARRRGSLSLPVTVTLEHTDGTRARVRWEGEGTVFEVLSRPGLRVRAAWVDPENRISLDENRLNNAVLAEGEVPSVAPLFARLSYWVGLALQALGP